MLSVCRGIINDLIRLRVMGTRIAAGSSSRTNDRVSLVSTLVPSPAP